MTVLTTNRPAPELHQSCDCDAEPSLHCHACRDVDFDAPEQGAPTGPSVTNVSTDAEFDEWIEDADAGFYFGTDARGQAYVLFCNEDGDWWATRPAGDDDEREDGTYPGGVTVDIDTLARPITIQTVAVTR